jgi:hypothetical protein
MVGFIVATACIGTVYTLFVIQALNAAKENTQRLNR